MHSNLFNEDFQEFVAALNSCEVEYILVGGFSVILHGYNRTTGDLDIWTNPTAENYQRLKKAFARFGMPVFDMTEIKFLATAENDVFTFGRPPVCIEILTNVKGLEFAVAFEKSAWFSVEENLNVRGLHKSDLQAAKVAAGRPKDLDDLEKLKNVKC